MNETSETFRRLRDRQLSWTLRNFLGRRSLRLAGRSFPGLHGWLACGDAPPDRHIPVRAVYGDLWPPLAVFGAGCRPRRGRFHSIRDGALSVWTRGHGPSGLVRLLRYIDHVFWQPRRNRAVGISTLIFGAVGFLFISGVSTLAFTPLLYITSFTSWLTALCAMVLVGGLIVLALGTLNHEIENLVMPWNTGTRNCQE